MQVFRKNFFLKLNFQTKNEDVQQCVTSMKFFLTTSRILLISMILIFADWCGWSTNGTSKMDSLLWRCLDPGFLSGCLGVWPSPWRRWTNQPPGRKFEFVQSHFGNCLFQRARNHFVFEQKGSSGRENQERTTSFQKTFPDRQ